MRRVLLSAFIAAGLLGVISTQAVTASHEPADKVSASGSAAVVSGPNEEVVLLSEKIRTSSPTDLILGVTAECVITTELTTVGNDLESAEAQVEIWVEVDGVVVPVSTDDVAEPGRVTFCDRLDKRETTAFEDEDATIETLQRTGNANGFNWLKLNTGSGVHTIEVKAEMTHAATDGASVLSAVGKRTLIIEPVKAANDETVTEIG